MITQDRVLIMVTGTNIEPFSENYKECERTWIPALREIGFRVMIAKGDPILGNSQLPLDLGTNYYEVHGDNITFKTFDGKSGLFDKSINLASRWVLEKTDYEYYMRIDSDSFVHPSRLLHMLESNLQDFPDLDYMGCCHPWLGWPIHEVRRETICREGCFASGTSYMVSRRGMRIALDRMRIKQPIEFEMDDFVLGRAMWENGIPLLHDSRILFESKHRKMMADYHGVGTPDISDPNSHLAIQHYMSGHMQEAMERLGI